MIKIDYNIELFERNSLAIGSSLSHKMGWICVSRNYFKDNSALKIKDKRSRIDGDKFCLYHATDGLDFIKEMVLLGRHTELLMFCGIGINSKKENTQRIIELPSAVDASRNGIDDYYCLSEGEINDTDESLNYLFAHKDWKNSRYFLESNLYSSYSNRLFLSSAISANLYDVAKQKVTNTFKYGPFFQIIAAYHPGIVIMYDRHDRYFVYTSNSGDKQDVLKHLYRREFVFEKIKTSPKVEYEEPEVTAKTKTVLETNVDKERREIFELESLLKKLNKQKAELQSKLKTVKKDVDYLAADNGYQQELLVKYSEINNDLKNRVRDLSQFIGIGVGKAGRKIMTE